MSQFLLVDACLHPKNSDSGFELPPLQDIVEHLQVNFTVLPLDDGVKDSDEDVSI